MSGAADQDLELEEAFDALVVESAELTPPIVRPGASASSAHDATIPANVRRGTSASSASVEEAALHAMLPARGMTTPGWEASSAQPPRATVHALQTPSDGTSTAPLRTHGAAIFCPTCKGPVDVRSRHVAVQGGAVRVYCSAPCLDRRDELPAETAPVALESPPRRRRAWWLAALAIPAGIAAYVVLRDAGDASYVPPPPAVASTSTPADPEPSASDDPQQEADAALTQELMHDAWIHPLAGPKRRMPVNHNGAFGAERAGERPPECVSGHCGVDLGNTWGEPVYAVHEGVIDFVNRGPNEERGGVFVRIAHRNGTLFSWYFHLAAVPKWIRPGVKVTAGTMIGLLGDTGIKHSAPHLHFALSVKTSKHVRERYLDPEPLVAIWPLWIPNQDGSGGVVSNAEEPGIPVRASGGKRRGKVKDRAETAASTSAAETSASSSVSESLGSDAAATGTVN
jgi:murein DD-endopeptidase MepM/ murein hydrolase activator NlpD